MLFIDSLPLLRRSNPKSWAGLRWNVALTDRGNSSSPDPTDVTPYNFSRHQLHHRLAHSYNISTIRFQFQSLLFSPCVSFVGVDREPPKSNQSSSRERPRRVARRDVSKKRGENWKSEGSKVWSPRFPTARRNFPILINGARPKEATNAAAATLHYERNYTRELNLTNPHNTGPTALSPFAPRFVRLIRPPRRKLS